MAKILVVDDNDQNRTLLHDVLTHYGYTVLLAADGTDGVHLAREEKPDLILMDIQMPVMDGIAAGKILRSDPLTKGITILALTSYNLLRDDENFFGTGFDGYLNKPINLRNLLETLKKYLSDGHAS